MTRLYLLRHGIAVPHGTAGVREDERPLTPEGERKVAEVAEGLRRLGIEPDRIVTSPLPRARRTAEIAADVLKLEGRLEDAAVLRPESSPREIRDWLATRGESSLMLVGHNPNLSELLGLLAGLPDGVLPFELKKGGVAALECENRAPYAIEWIATPRLIRKLMD